MLINTIRKTASTRGVNFVQIDYWQQRISLFSSTRSEASFLATSCHSLGIWTDILVPAHTERRTSIHTSIGCSGQAVCSKLWESFKRNYASHEMSGRYPIHPDPFHLKKCLFFFTDFKDKFKSYHVCLAISVLWAIKPVFSTETTISNTKIFYVLRDFCNSKPFNITTSQNFFSIYILGHQVHGRTPYRRQVASHSHLSPIRIYPLIHLLV